MASLDARHVDPPPGASVHRLRPEIERRLREGEAHLARHVEHARERDEVVAGRAEAVHQHDERPIAPPLPVSPPGEADVKPAESLVSHDAPPLAEDGAPAPCAARPPTELRVGANQPLSPLGGEAKGTFGA